MASNAPRRLAVSVAGRRYRRRPCLCSTILHQIVRILSRRCRIDAAAAAATAQKLPGRAGERQGPPWWPARRIVASYINDGDAVGRGRRGRPAIGGPGIDRKRTTDERRHAQSAPSQTYRLHAAYLSRTAAPPVRRRRSHHGARGATRICDAVPLRQSVGRSAGIVDLDYPAEGRAERARCLDTPCVVYA